MRAVYPFVVRLLLVVSLVMIVVGLYTAGMVHVVSVSIYRFFPDIGVLWVHAPELSDRTVQQVAEIEQTIDIVGYYYDVDIERQRRVDVLLRAYGEFTDQIQYRFIDLDVAEASAQNKELMTSGTLVITSDDRQIIIQDTADDTEIMQGILKVSQAHAPLIYVLNGYGGRSIHDSSAEGISVLSDVLRSRSLDVQQINLDTPQDQMVANSVLIIVDPQQEITAEVMEKIKVFVDSGGNLLLFSNPLSPAPLASVLESWGLEWQNDFVVDEQSQSGNPLALAVVEYPLTPVTRNMSGQTTVFNSVRTILDLGTATDGVKRTVLLRSSTRSSAATEFFDGQIKVNASDKVGPLEFGYLVETPSNGRVVLIGDADFVSNSYIAGPEANEVLVMSILDWLMY
jgi:hypothetical protein